MATQRQPVIWAIATVGAIYWGLLLYWQREYLFDDLPEDLAGLRTRAILGIGATIPYVAYIIWALRAPLPGGLSEVRFIGKYGKFTGWLSFVVGAVVWAVKDTEYVGFLFVGGLLMGLAVGLILVCLMYSGDDSSRLYALKRMVDVYPSIKKPEGHVRFNQKLWTTTLVLIIYFAMTNLFYMVLA